MDMAHASGTLERLNEAYDNDIALMQGKINKLTTQNKTLKDRLSQTEAFIKMKGLWEDLVEFFRPKSIQKRIQENKRQIALEDAKRPKREAKKDKGIAI